MSALQELARFAFELFRPPKAQTVSEWADENSVLVSESSSAPGRWNTDDAPYQREIMDSFTQPGIWQTVVIAPAQIGKSAMMLNMMARAIDLDPGPMLMVQPTVEAAGNFSKERIEPSFKACAALREKVYEAKSRDSSNTIYEKSFPGGYLAMVGANAPTGLASRPIRYLFMDEIDRYPRSAGVEGDPIKLAEKRTATFRHNRRIAKFSTPTIKGASKIEDAYMSGTQEEWQTECPHCHRYSFIRFDDIKFEYTRYDTEGEKGFTVQRVDWECPHCRERTGEYDAKRQPAKWVAQKPEAIENGVRSFRPNAFMSPWSDWKEIAREFLMAGKDPALLQTFHNLTLGESWELNEKSGVPEKLYARREHYDAEVPTGVLLLTMAIDTQDNRLEYEVKGWDRSEQSWGIEKGVIPGRADAPGVWEEVDALLDREWTMRSGMRLRIIATFIDSGGTHTEAVYEACARRAGRNIWPIKGEAGSGKPYVRVMKSGGAVKRGNVGFIIGVDSGKEAIMYATTLEEPGPKYMHFPIDASRGYDLEYFKGLISEKPVIHRRGGQATVVWEQTVARNEPLDLSNYNRAAYKFFHWNFDRLEAALRGESAAPIMKAEARKKKKKQLVKISEGIKV